MGRAQVNRGSHSAIERFFPTLHAYAPLVARFQAGKIPFRMRSNQVVTLQDGEIEKLARHHRAHRVKTDVARTRFAKSVTIKASQRIAATTFQFLSKHICGHIRTITRRSSSCHDSHGGSILRH